MPILAWLVEHPEGRFIIDTGGTAANSTPGYLPQRWPIWFRPDLVVLDGPAVGPFPSSHALTHDGRVHGVREALLSGTAPRDGGSAPGA